MAVLDRPFKPPLVLRQPPPPVRLPKGGSPMHGIHSGTLGKRKEEDKTESCSDVAARTRPFYFRRCKSKMLKSTSTAYTLPDEIIFEILVRVPAEDLFNATRLVCRKWLRIIHSHDFVHAHLQQWNCGILAETEFTRTHQQPFLASGKSSCLVDLSRINYKFMFPILSSCNGLVLEIHDNLLDLYITNPLTMQSFVLPPFSSTSFFLPSCTNSKIRYVYAMGYAATSMEYKVVRAFTRCTTDESQDGGVAILTVGVDKEWTRVVNTRHLSLEAKYLCLSQHPLTTQGFVHWAKNNCSSDCVSTLNLETEIITQFSVPRSLHPRHDGEKKLVKHCYYLPMGSCLSLLIVRSMFSWEFWEMKPNTGEWTKQTDIDFEAQFAGQLNCTLKPGGWLKFGEVLVFNVSHDKSDPRFPAASRVCFACNIRTHEFQKFEFVFRLKHFLAHSKSLEWLV